MATRIRIGEIMTWIHNSVPNINSINFQNLHEELIPCCSRLISYSELLSGYCEYIIKLLDQSDLQLADKFLLLLSQEKQGDRAALVAAFEAEHPALFKQLYGDLLTRFYSAPETAARVQALADQGPREASPYFDPSLLHAVISNQFGKRRL